MIQYLKLRATGRRVVVSVLAAVVAAVLCVFVPQAVLYLLALWFVASGSTVFVIVYHSLARWWESPMGQNIMLLMFSLATLADLLLVNVLLDRPDWMRWVFLALYVAVGSAIWWRVALLVKAQRPRTPRP